LVALTLKPIDHLSKFFRTIVGDCAWPMEYIKTPHTNKISFFMIKFFIFLFLNMNSNLLLFVEKSNFI